ncbi:MAG: hypothetical protein JWP87_4840 [Labilithrix sp.]|nr:hypothetical protein [Labilithrix sp.]
MSAGVRSLSVLALLVVPGLAACAGAGNQDLFDETAEGNDTSSADPTPSSQKPPGTSSTPAPTPGAKDPEGPQANPGACTQEVESNDDKQSATKFQTSLCGKIDSANDIDWASFTVPVDAKTVSLTTSEKGGAATYRYYLLGQSIGTNVDELKVLPGATYMVQIRPNRDNGNGGLPTYQLDVSFQ